MQISYGEISTYLLLIGPSGDLAPEILVDADDAELLLRCL